MQVKDIAIDIVKKLNHSGYQAFFAGGWVRDYLMDHPSDDIDIATNAPPQVILDLFPHTILVGLAFGVVIIVMGEHQFEITTFRKDVEYINGRKPESIELSNAEEDAKRRDFTINGMFFDPIEEKIYDYVKGMEDLKTGIIRTIGDPFERFLEDRLRMMRAIRFSARFGFPIDLDTQQAILENAYTLFPAVAMERVWNEFVKMSKYSRFESAIIDMHRLGLLPVIFPQLKHVHLHDIRHRVSAFSNFPKNTPTIVYIAELFPDFNAEQLEEVCAYLRTSTQDAKLATFIHSGKKLLSQKDLIKDIDRVYFYAHHHSQLCLDIYAAYLPIDEKAIFYQKHSKHQERLKQFIRRLKDKKPLITSAILKTYGISPSKKMGILLKEAEEQAILHQLEHVDQVMEILKKSENWPSEGI